MNLKLVSRITKSVLECEAAPLLRGLMNVLTGGLPQYESALVSGPNKLTGRRM